MSSSPPRSEYIPPPLAELFAAANLAPEKLNEYRDKFPDLPFRLPRFQYVWQDWRRLQPLVNSYADALLAGAKDPAHIFDVATDALGIPTPPAALTPATDFASEIQALADLSETPELPSAASIEAIPTEVATAAAQVLHAIRSAWVEVDKALPWRREISPLRNDEYASEVLHFATQYVLGPNFGLFVRNTDLALLAAAAKRIACATEQARAAGPSPKEFRFEWISPLGRIEIGGGGPHRYNLQDTLFVLDVGTENTYIGGQPGRQAISVVIDGGRSEFVDVGPTVFGVAEFFVLSGCNRFITSSKGTNTGGVGGAAFGVSMIHCQGGANQFDARDLSQGAAVFGIGAVVTNGGSNIYRCYSLSQGFGGAGGFGCLVDSEGDCQYLAEDSFRHRDAPQTPRTHNESSSQGVGKGRRGSIPGDDMAGGIGILVNGGGKNRFRCGVFGQGAGYLMGLGGLVVKGPGNDFGGVWYVQGAAAHYAFGCLTAKGGENQFHASEEQGQGVGVDYGIGLLHTKGGNSRFTGGKGRLGMGIENGIGICTAEGHSNHFEPATTGMGYAQRNEAKPDVPCFGIFADEEARDSAKANNGGTIEPLLTWQPRLTPDAKTCGFSWQMSPQSP